MLYDSQFVTGDDLFARLWDELAWIRHADAPRREYWTNDLNRDYTYGRGAGIRTYAAQPSHDIIEMVRTKLMEETGVWYEGCFLNGYEGAKDWLGWHSDDDPGIDHNKPIAIVSLYGDPKLKPRSIQFRKIINDNFGGIPNEVIDHPLDHGSLCVMPVGFQFTHQHRIPKAGFVCASRISLTFRSLL